ncbi:hypothetical protein [Bacillus sp. WP8]|nr:hypothetical protein [Bacillus sp. WP8]
MKNEGAIGEDGIEHGGEGVDVDLRFEYGEEKWVDNIEEIV